MAERDPRKSAANIVLLIGAVAAWGLVAPTAAFAAWVAIAYGDLDSPSFEPEYGVAGVFIVITLGVTWFAGYAALVAWRNLRRPTT
jgi:hypothetical protein